MKALRVESEWLALAGDASLETATGKLAAALRWICSLRKLAQFPPVAALLTDSPFRELAGTVGVKADVRRAAASIAVCRDFEPQARGYALGGLPNFRIRWARRLRSAYRSARSRNPAPLPSAI